MLKIPKKRIKKEHLPTPKMVEHTQYPMVKRIFSQQPGPIRAGPRFRGMGVIAYQQWERSK